jgi:hypothetical protein
LVYEIGIGECKPVKDLSSKIVNQNSIQLFWSHPSDSLFIKKYQLYRNDKLLVELQKTKNYLDENLPSGSYEYFVVTYYTNGCFSIGINKVTEIINAGIKNHHEFDNIVLYPNPTTGVLQVQSSKFKVLDVELIDVFGRNVKVKSSSNSLEGWMAKPDGVVVNISHLDAGIYLIKITTEKGTITKKIIKY